MKLRQNHSIETAAAKAGMSRATGYRIASAPRLPSQDKEPRGRRRPDPLGQIFETEVVPLLRSAPGLRLASGEPHLVVMAEVVRMNYSTNT